MESALSILLSHYDDYSSNAEDERGNDTLRETFEGVVMTTSFAANYLGANPSMSLIPSNLK